MAQFKRQDYTSKLDPSENVASFKLKGLQEKTLKEKICDLVENPLVRLGVVAFLFSFKSLAKILKDKPEWLKKLLVTRVAGWAIENGCVFGLNAVRSFIPSPQCVNSNDEIGNEVPTSEKVKQVLRNILYCMMSCLATEVGTVFVLHGLSKYVYDFVPYFVKQRKATNPFTSAGFKDWLKGNAYLQIIGGGVLLGIIESFVPKSWADDINNAPAFSLPQFIRNFGLFRVVADLIFYFAHRAMHSHPMLYKWIHKRHHEHYTTNLTTNFHFSALDLFIESALPMFAGMLALRFAGVRLGRFELHLLMGYTAWYELGTHMGKPLNIISTFPPLSVFYNTFFNVDGRAIEFHETHHNRRHCNYGITTWLDKLLKTEEFEFRGH